MLILIYFFFLDNIIIYKEKLEKRINFNHLTNFYRFCCCWCCCCWCCHGCWRGKWGRLELFVVDWMFWNLFITRLIEVLMVLMLFKWKSLHIDFIDRRLVVIDFGFAKQYMWMMKNIPVKHRISFFLTKKIHLFLAIHKDHNWLQMIANQTILFVSFNFKNKIHDYIYNWKTWQYNTKNLTYDYAY